jgi:monoamine oxidase
VKTIDYSKDGLIEITVSNTSNHNLDGSQSKIYKAHKVIVTVPLAVLGDIKFNPSLSDEKQKSLQALGIAKMDKLIIEFEEVFWDTETDWFNFIAETPGDWAQTLNLYKYFKKPMLMMFNADPNTERFESMTDSEVLEDGLNALKKMFNDADKIKAINFMRTNWLKDPFAKSSFTYIKAGSTPDDCEVLARNIDNKVFFAGEHTCFEFIGSVNGAYISG